MRIGYSYWGFLGDHKFDEAGNPASTPDGNATYSWSIIWELLTRGHLVYQMQQDRDAVGWRMTGPDGLFAAFSPYKRHQAWSRMVRTDGIDLPELDVLLLEWRFPIPGRNCLEDAGKPGYQPDLQRQHQLLRHYSGTKTKVIIWDLDHKVTRLDEEYWTPDAILETSVKPLQQAMVRRRVEFPTLTAELLQHETIQADPMRKLVYVGSRYERDDVITEYVKPASDAYPGQVEFHGNWLNSLEACRELWPNVSFNGRITTNDFWDVYSTAVACPLLAKRSYIETGFITPRPWEAVLFGTIPVGIRQMRGIGRYVTHSVGSGDEMVELLYELSQLTLKERDILRQECAHKLSFMDARHFIDVIEEVADESYNVVPEEHHG